MKYNGWSNKHTWAVNRWLYNDKELNARTIKLAKEAQSTNELAEELSGLVREEVFYLNRPGSLAFDLLDTALDEVDWLELARAWIRD